MLEIQSGPVRRTSPTFIAWGLVAILLGVAILAWPQLTSTVLVGLLGAGLLLAGLFLLYAALRLRGTRSLWWLPLVPGIALTAFGALTLLAPEQVASFFIVVAAIIVILAGIGDAAMAISWRAVLPGWWVRLLRGLVFVLLGVWVIVTPVSGLVALGWLVGIAVIAIGALSVWLGLLVRRVA